MNKINIDLKVIAVYEDIPPISHSISFDINIKVWNKDELSESSIKHFMSNFIKTIKLKDKVFKIYDCNSSYTPIYYYYCFFGTNSQFNIRFLDEHNEESNKDNFIPKNITNGEDIEIIYLGNSYLKKITTNNVNDENYEKYDLVYCRTDEEYKIQENFFISVSINVTSNNSCLNSKMLIDIDSVDMISNIINFEGGYYFKYEYYEGIKKSFFGYDVPIKLITRNNITIGGIKSFSREYVIENIKSLHKATKNRCLLSPYSHILDYLIDSRNCDKIYIYMLDNLTRKDLKEFKTYRYSRLLDHHKINNYYYNNTMSNALSFQCKKKKWKNSFSSMINFQKVDINLDNFNYFGSLRDLM